MYEVLDESLQRAEMNHNITYGTSPSLCHFMLTHCCISCSFYSPFSPAILYECVRCIYTVYPKSDLLEKAAKCIGNFVLSPKINLKYLGKRKVFDLADICKVCCSKCLYFMEQRLEGSDLRGSAGSQTSPPASGDHHRMSRPHRPHHQAWGEAGAVDGCVLMCALRLALLFP